MCVFGSRPVTTHPEPRGGVCGNQDGGVGQGTGRMTLLQQEVAETRPFRWATMTGPSVPDRWAPWPLLTKVPVTGMSRAGR